MTGFCWARPLSVWECGKGISQSLAVEQPMSGHPGDGPFSRNAGANPQRISLFWGEHAGYGGDPVGLMPAREFRGGSRTSL